MIVSDNEVSPSELEELYRIAHQFYGYSEEEINSTVLSQGTALYNPDTIEEKLQYLYELALIACADGIIKQEEIQLLKYYALEFGFKKENIDEIVEFLIANAKEKNEVNEVILKLYN